MRLQDYTRTVPALYPLTTPVHLTSEPAGRVAMDRGEGPRLLLVSEPRLDLGYDPGLDLTQSSSDGRGLVGGDGVEGVGEGAYHVPAQASHQFGHVEHRQGDAQVRLTGGLGHGA